MKDLGELAGIYVDPAASKRGIGKALMAEAENQLSQAGYSSAYLWVLYGNDRAMKFYDEMGWQPDGEEKVGSAGGARELREVRYSKLLQE